MLRHIALDLLAHYLGRGPAERVYAGQIERGDVSRIEAAILICDLRGFTAMTDRAQHGEIVSLLNRWFEVIGAAIGGHRGDILKFMGDGLLAVFPLEESRGATCDRALDAALAALAGTEALNKELAQEGAPAARLRHRAALGRGGVRQYRHARPARFHRHRAGGQPRQPAAGADQDSGHAGPGIGGVRGGDVPAIARPGPAAGARDGRGSRRFRTPTVKVRTRLIIIDRFYYGIYNFFVYHCFEWMQ